MDVNNAYFNKRKERARMIYDAEKSIYNPYLQSQISLNSDGFHHLQFSARREREKKEQLLKFSLLPLALRIIKKSGTLQEYRSGLTSDEKKRNGMTTMRPTDYWAFVAIIGDNQIKIRVILKRVGNGNIIFWSVMPYSKLRDNQKLFTDGIEEG